MAALTATKLVTTSYPAPSAPPRQPEPAAVAHRAAETAATPRREQEFWGDDGFDFFDLLDMINPLQHLPVIGTVYRAITGDAIAPGARLVGGTVFGGPLGFASAMVNIAVEQETGKDLGDHALALFTDEGTDGAADALQLAAAARAPALASTAPTDPAVRNAAGSPPPSSPQVAVGTPVVVDPAPVAAAVPAAAVVPAQERNPQLARYLAGLPPARGADQPKPGGRAFSGWDPSGSLQAARRATGATPAAAAETARAARGREALAEAASKPERPSPVGPAIVPPGLRPDPLTVERALRAQGLAPREHPMIPPAPATGPVTAPATATVSADIVPVPPKPVLAAPPAGPWGNSAVAGAIGRYQRAEALGGSGA